MILPAVRCVIAVFEELEDDAVAEHRVENMLRSKASVKKIQSDEMKKRERANRGVQP
jgi:hypothetical protein